MTLAIVDLGCANLGSVRMAFERLCAEPITTDDRDVIRSASKVVLPGVGSAAYAMRRVEELELTPVLRQLTQPVLGICLGMQILFERSDEQDTDCLGILEGSVRKIEPRPGFPVPHMGWSRVTSANCEPSPDYYYFAHSYAYSDRRYTIATATHGGPIAAIVRSGNFLGAQFHPERSGQAGASFLKSFLQQ